MLDIQTAVVNNPDFIELQHKTLAALLSGEFSFTVFNDAKQWPDFSNFGNPNVYQEIRAVCDRLGIPCIDIPNSHHIRMTDAARRCADSMNFMLKHSLKTGLRQVLILDSDMFLVCPADVNMYDSADCAVVPQERGSTKYIWNGIAYFDFGRVWAPELLDWRAGEHKGELCDVGGAMTYWLDEKPGDASIYIIDHLISLQWDEHSFPKTLSSSLLRFLQDDPKNNEGKFYCELYDERFLHYRAGGNWDRLPKSVHLRRTDQLCRALEITTEASFG